MPPTMADDPVLSALRAEYQSKYQEADAIIRDPNATGDRLRRAETLSEECKGLEGKIESRMDEVERIGRVKGQLGESGRWADDRRRTLPFSASLGGVDAKRYGTDGAAEFRLGGWEEAGENAYAYDPRRKLWDMVRESGPGILNRKGEKVWNTLGSFEYKLAFAAYLREGSWAFDGVHRKSLQEGMDDQGGVFAPAEFIARVIGRLPAPTSLRGLVNTLTTGRDEVILPRKQYNGDDKYTTAFRVNWTGEIPADGTGAQAAVDDTKLLGTIAIPVHTAMLNGAFTRNMIEDSAFPLQAWLEQEFAQIIDLLYEDMILNGTGNGQPSGILLGAASGNDGTSAQYPEVILSSTSGNIDYGQLDDIQTALAPQYENDGTRWVMNKKSTWRAIRKLVDGNNRPYFTDGAMDYGYVKGRGRVLLGDEIAMSQFAPNIGSSNFPLIYGDLKGFFLAQRVGFGIQILDQTKAKVNQIELVGRVRFGGKVVEPWRLKIGKSHSS